MSLVTVRTIMLSMVCVAAGLFLHGCDSLTYGKIELQSPLLSKDCVAQAERYLPDEDRLIVAPSGVGDEHGARLEMLRERYSIGGMLETTSARVMKLSFQELGRVDREVERQRLQLLDDTLTAIVTACQLAEPEMRTMRSCQGRMCEKWLAGHSTP